jgi:hypothetical protein
MTTFIFEIDVVRKDEIDLDNGHTIWGCQCWWGPEDVVKHHMEAYEKEGFTINIVDPKIYSRGGVG